MRFIMTLIVLFCSLSNAWAQDVVVVSVFGARMSPKVEDFKSINAKIGELVANFKLKSFEIMAFGIEGGYVACLQPNMGTDATSVSQEMSSLKVDATETMYSVEVKSQCK